MAENPFPPTAKPAELPPKSYFRYSSWGKSDWAKYIKPIAASLGIPPETMDEELWRDA